MQKEIESEVELRESEAIDVKVRFGALIWFCRAVWIWFLFSTMMIGLKGWTVAYQVMWQGKAVNFSMPTMVQATDIDSAWAAARQEEKKKRRD
jgi:uncharacterized membrane protein